jgi:condensin-2 complex subunit D3
MTAETHFEEEWLMETIQNDILSLLHHSDPDLSNNASLMNPDTCGGSHETVQLCQELLNAVQSRKSAAFPDSDSVEESTADHENFIRTNIPAYSNKTGSAALNVRQVLGNLPSSTTSKLAPLFTNLMSDRVDVADLLPATQDDVANEDAMGKMAITLTKQAFLAAELYVELIGMPGAWGAGLINVGTLSGLSALLRRWKLECCGNQEAGEDDIFALEGNRKRKPSKDSKTNTTKRSKEKKSTVVIDIEDSTDDEESTDSLIIEDEDAGFSAVLSKRDLVMGGLCVSRALARAQVGKEFVAWSCEAREAYVDSAVTALLTAGAMTAPATKTAKVSKDPELDALRRSVPPLLSVTLKRCFVDPSADSVSDDDNEGINSEYERAERNHETIVAILRGLFPSFVLQMELPKGQKGKEAAHALAVSTLEGITELVAKQYELSSALASVSTTLKTPSKLRTPGTEKSSTNTTMPGMSHSSRKKRVSFFGDLSDVVSPEKVVPPTLKLTSTPMRNRALVSTGLTPTHGRDRPRPVLSAVLGLLQKLATFKGLDRTNIRNHIINTLCKALPCLPLLERTCFLHFLIHLCHSKVSVHRLMCVDLVGRILSKPWLWNEHSAQTVSPILGKSPTTMTPSTRASFSPIVECSTENMPLALMSILEGRLTDRTPAVRARTAYAISEMLETVSEEDVKEVGINPTSEFVSSLELASNGLARKLRKRAALDEGATVRKAAVNAFVGLVEFDKGMHSLCSEADITMLSDLCSDSSVAVRKAAADGLTSLLLCFSRAEGSFRDIVYVLEEKWPSAIMPMVGDIEATCVAKAVDLFYQTTIEPLVGTDVEDLTSDVSLSPECLSAWHLLARVSERSVQEGAARGEFGALRTLVGKLAELYDGETLQRLLLATREVAIRSLEDLACTLNRRQESQLKGSWCMLEALADQDKKPVDLSKLTRKRSFSLGFLSTSLDKLFCSFQANEFDHSGMTHSAMKSCIKVISKWSPHLHVEDTQHLLDRIKVSLRKFELPTDVVGSAITAVVALTNRVSGDNTKQECSAWILELNKSCEDSIARFVALSDQSLNEGTELVRALFTVGELSMIGFKADEDTFSSGVASQKNLGSSSDDPVAGMYEPPSDRLLSLVQAMLAKKLPKYDVATPESVRAHAFLTLGKFCLRNESLAKSSLTILARELHKSESDMHPSVQSNALLVLGDLCVRYTNLVDRYLPVMARCLQSGIAEQTSNSLFDGTQDQTSLVRKHAVLLLTGLLLQDYIKWRGLLFQRFLVATADRDEGVARLAEMSLCGPLLKKYPKLFFNNFVESLFVLNKFTCHRLYAAAASAGDNGAGVTVGFEGINLSGEAGRAARKHIYATAISKMSSEEKIGITARLANDVLGAALETDGDLARVCRKSSVVAPLTNEENAYNVLCDALFILTSPALQVARVPISDDAVGLEETGAASKAQHVAAAKGKLLSKISRKQLVEMVLPILCNLKTTLEESCSPLLKDLMQYLVVIYCAYKVEVKEVLANDPTLLQEIEYDARQFKKNQRLNSPTGAVVVVSESEGE